MLKIQLKEKRRMLRTRVRIGLETGIVEARATFHGTRPFMLLMSVRTCAPGRDKTRCNQTRLVDDFSFSSLHQGRSFLSYTHSAPQLVL